MDTTTASTTNNPASISPETTIENVDEDVMMMDLDLDQDQCPQCENAKDCDQAMDAFLEEEDNTDEDDKEFSDQLAQIIEPFSDTTTSSSALTAAPELTKRPAIPLYLSCNPDYLSDYQCLIRKNVELFEAYEWDLQQSTKGRSKKLALGQVGIRCVHCARVYPIDSRAKGSMYFPRQLMGIYQAAQVLCQNHLLEGCSYVPTHIREQLQRLKDGKKRTQAGKDYWAVTAQALGVYEDQYGLRFTERLGPPANEDLHIPAFKAAVKHGKGILKPLSHGWA